MLKHNKIHKSILIGASLALLLTVLLLTLVAIRSSQDIRRDAAPATSLALSTSAREVKVGDQITIDVVIDTDVNWIAGAELDIRFNPQYLEITSFAHTDFFGTMPDTVGPNIDNTNGRVSFEILAMLGEPAQGAGIMARMTAKAKSAGSTDVTFGPDTIVAGTGEDTMVNVLKDIYPLTLTITSGTATPTPTPMPTPIPTPTPTPTKSPTPTPTSPGGGGPTPSPTATPAGSLPPYPVGDINRDYKVDILDYTLLFENYGQKPPVLQAADINNDGRVGLLDYVLLYENYGVNLG